MEIIKQTKEFTIYKKRNGRHAVRGANKQWLNGEEKVQILLKEGLIKLSEPRPEEAPADEGEEASEENTEAESE